MVSDRIRAMGALHWIVLFALILAAWLMLFAMSVPSDLRIAARVYGADFWASLCIVTPDAAGLARVFAMWMLMSGAMMAPTALPAFATYEDIGRQTQTNFAALVAGYVAVWVGYSAVAALLQMWLFNVGLLNAVGDSQSALFSATLLGLAGAYQFSPVKDACLSKCRQPLTFFMGHFEEGPWRNGLRLGLVCLGCCWALMLLAFVGGVMNLAFMGLATVIMVLEKLPDIGRYITRPLGIILLLSAASLAFSAFI